FSRRCRDKRVALRIEYAIKQLTRPQKEALVGEPTRVAGIVRRARRELRAAVARRILARDDLAEHPGR
ncbi:MAG TPA: hypothetical protein VIV11_38085, partial [Kofleriaceae bacterium]